MPGGGTPLFGLYGYVPLNRVWFTISPLSVWNSVSFCTGNLSKRAKTCDAAVYICNTNNFFLNIYFHDFSVKNYLIVYAKQNKSGSESSVSCLKQGSEMSNFCLIKQGWGLKPSAAQLYQDFPWVPPPGSNASFSFHINAPLFGVVYLRIRLFSFLFVSFFT